MMKKRFAAAVTITLAALSIFGCSNSAGQNPQTTQSATAAAKGSATEATANEEASSGADVSADKGGKTFGVTYQIESDFFKTVADSITSAAEVDGNETVVVDAQQDSTKQVRVIEDLIARNMNAALLSPVDGDVVAPALQKLKEAGIPVISFDSSIVNLSLVNAYVATDNLQAGELCVETMIKDFPGRGLIAILNYPVNNACPDREKGFLETIEDKGFEAATAFDAEDAVGKGQNITSDISQAHPNIVVVFSINDQAGMGACAVCTTSGANVSIYGMDGASEAKQVIAREGSICRATTAQSPIRIGTSCYDVTVTILSDEGPVQFQIDTSAFTIDSTNIQDYLGAGWQ